MHCPQCGTLIESAEISYCTRCGQMLERIRAAMSDEAAIARRKEVSRAGLNLGVVLMYAGLCPALLTVILSPSAIPLALLMLIAALAAIMFGSGPLVRLFQVDEIHPEVELARRKEIAFGATLMFIASIIATPLVAIAVPDSWAKTMLIGSVTGLFGALLAGSKPLYAAYLELGNSGDRAKLESRSATRELETRSLDADAVEFRMPPPKGEGLLAPSVTEDTTRLLRDRDDV